MSFKRPNDGGYGTWGSGYTGLEMIPYTMPAETSMLAVVPSGVSNSPATPTNVQPSEALITNSAVINQYVSHPVAVKAWTKGEDKNIPIGAILFCRTTDEIEDGIPRSTSASIPMLNLISEEGAVMEQQKSNAIVSSSTEEINYRALMYVHRPRDGTSSAGEFAKKYAFYGIKGQDLPASQSVVSGPETRNFTLFVTDVIETPECFGTDIKTGDTAYTITKEFLFQDENVRDPDGNATTTKTEADHYALQTIPVATRKGPPEVCTITHEQYKDCIATNDYQCLNTPGALDVGYIAIGTLVDLKRYERKIVNGNLVIEDKSVPDNSIMLNLFQVGTLNKLGRVLRKAKVTGSQMQINESYRRHAALGSLKNCELILNPKVM